MGYEEITSYKKRWRLTFPSSFPLFYFPNENTFNLTRHRRVVKDLFAISIEQASEDHSSKMFILAKLSVTKFSTCSWLHARDFPPCNLQFPSKRVLFIGCQSGCWSKSHFDAELGFKNIIRDGGSTALLTADTARTVYTAYTAFLASTAHTV